MRDKSMNDALKARKARGLDLTILIDGVDALQQGAQGAGEAVPVEEEQEQKDLGLAPEASPVNVEEQGAPKEKMMIEQELMKMGKGTLADKARMMKR